MERIKTRVGPITSLIHWRALSVVWMLLFPVSALVVLAEPPAYLSSMLFAAVVVAFGNCVERPSRRRDVE